MFSVEDDIVCEKQAVNLASDRKVLVLKTSWTSCCADHVTVATERCSINALIS